MKLRPLALAVLLSMAVSISLTGCSNDKEMSQEEIQYLSHIDQAHFFQRQGELKASTLEARSAIELQPHAAEPYFIIVDNMLTAGDAVNAEHQVNKLADRFENGKIDDAILNRINLIRAKAKLMQGKFKDALSKLDDLKAPDRSQKLRAALLKGDILLASNQLGDARKAYENAKSIDENAIKAYVGLSRVAFASKDNNEAQLLIDQAIQIDKTDPELWLWRAQFAQASKQWAKSEDAYIRALEDIGQYDIMTYRKYQTISALIRVLREEGKTSEAFVYEEILAKSAPGTIKSNLAAARKAYENGDLTGAARYLEEILAQAPNHQQSALLLGMIRFRQGRTEEAEKLLAPLVEADNSNAASKLLAATKIQLHQPGEARKILDKLDGQQTDPGLLALVGVAALASGDKNGGKTYIEKSLELQPDNLSLRLRYARYLLQSGQTDAAIEQATQAVKQQPDSNEARILIIQAHLVAKNVSSATETANAWVKEQPDNITARLTRGQIALQQNDPEEAKKYFQEAAKLAPKNPAPLIALGNLAREQKDQADAVTQFKKAVTLAPNNRDALRGLGSVLGRQDTVSFLNQLLKNKPDATGPKLVLLEAALINGNHDEADKLTATLLEPEALEEPAKLAPVVATVYDNAARHTIQTREPDKAREILNRARTLFPDNEDIALQAAALALRSNRKKDAMDILQETKLNHPESARPFLVEAGDLSEQGRNKEAAELYQLALDKHQDIDTEIQYAQALQRAKQPSKAIEALTKALKTYPNQPRLNLMLALAYQSANQPVDATTAYEAVVSEEPNNPVALNNLAWMYQQANDKRALPTAEKAYNINPDSAAIADTYGWILFNEGKHDESIPVLEKAYKLQPEAKDIALHLAEAYKAVGEEGKAKVILEKM